MPQKISLVTDGTWGDVLPFVFLGKELAARGHSVRIFCNEYYKEYCQSQGLEHVTTTSLAMRTRMLSNPNLWKPIMSLGCIGRDTEEIFTASIDVLKSHLKDSDIIVAHTFTYASRTVAELYGIEYVSLLISPIQARNASRLPVFYGGINPNRFPDFIRKNFYKVGDWLILDRLFGTAINAKRKELGLDPISSFVHWGTSPTCAIGLWDEWYASGRIDIGQLHLVGFARGVQMGKSDPELLEWMRGGLPPIVITMGSGYRFIDSWDGVIKEIVRTTGRRCIVLGPHDKSDTDDVIYRNSVLLTEVLPLAGLCIHHGGAGMVAQTLAAGVPSVILPMAHDQPDNAHLVRSLGLAEVVWMTTLSARKVLPAIKRVLESAQIREAATKRGEQVRASRDGIVGAADIIVQI